MNTDITPRRAVLALAVGTIAAPLALAGCAQLGGTTTPDDRKKLIDNASYVVETAAMLLQTAQAAGWIEEPAAILAAKAATSARAAISQARVAEAEGGDVEAYVRAAIRFAADVSAIIFGETRQEMGMPEAAIARPVD